MSESSNLTVYSKKVLIAIILFAVMVLCILFLFYTFKVFLLMFAGVIVSILFRNIAYWFHQQTSLAMKWSLPTIVIGILLIITGITWGVSAYTVSQVEQLSEQIPKTIQQVEKGLRNSERGKSILEYIEKKDIIEKIGGQTQKFFSTVFGVFGVIGDIYAILFLGIFILVNPAVYVNGFLHLIPLTKRPRMEEIIYDLENTISNWIAGQLISMLIVAISIWVGLLIAGIPLALVLGITAGLFAFIPNFGPFIALGLGLTVAASQGWTAMLWTTVIYLSVQLIESNFITPYIQQRMVAIPTAMILIAQLVLGIFSGALGLILAMPIFAVMMVLIQRLYVEDTLGDDTFKSKT